jgi:catechol 2,3-dioxygenase-like lactoylglutathione lyase family enzyme
MQPWPKRVYAITLFVDDLPATKAFYENVFGVPTAFEDDDSTVFEFGNILVNLLRTEAAPELVAPAKVGRVEAGVRQQLTIDVDDVDRVCRELVEHGVELLNGPIDRPWGVRTAAFQDPSGHVWEIATTP